jgi:hypothetical protein
MLQGLCSIICASSIPLSSRLLRTQSPETLDRAAVKKRPSRVCDQQGDAQEQDDDTHDESSDASSSDSARSRNIHTGLPSVPGDNPHNPPIAPLMNKISYQQMYSHRRFLTKWTKKWGPVSNWPSVIMEELEQCRKSGEEREWRRDMLAKLEQGRFVVTQLKAMFIVLPDDPWQVRDLWLQSVELLEHIQGGIACLVAHLQLEVNM